MTQGGHDNPTRQGHLSRLQGESFFHNSRSAFLICNFKPKKLEKPICFGKFGIGIYLGTKMGCGLWELFIVFRKNKEMLP